MALLTLRPICRIHSGILTSGASGFFIRSIVTHSQVASLRVWGGKSVRPSDSKLGRQSALNSKNFLSADRTQRALLMLPVRTMTSKSPTPMMSSISNPDKKENVAQPSTVNLTDDDDKKQAGEASAAKTDEGLSMKDKLKQAVRDYGATVLVFHVTMSLTSLGFFYLLVSSGLDVVSILEKVGIAGSITSSKVTEEASKFVLAYAIHKVFAPLRITITLGVTPLIVRKLRSMGILKQAVKKTNS